MIKVMLSLGQVRLSKGQLNSAGLEPPARDRNRRIKQPPNLFSIILDVAFYRKVHLIQNLHLHYHDT